MLILVSVAELWHSVLVKYKLAVISQAFQCVFNSNFIDDYHFRAKTWTLTKINCYFKVIESQSLLITDPTVLCTGSLAQQVPYYQKHSIATGNDTILCHSASIPSIPSKVRLNQEALAKPFSWLLSCEKPHYTDKLGQNFGAPVVMPGWFCLSLLIYYRCCQKREK